MKKKILDMIRKENSNGGYNVPLPIDTLISICTHDDLELMTDHNNDELYLLCSNCGQRFEE